MTAIDLDKVTQVQDPIIAEHAIAFDVEISYINSDTTTKAIFMLYDSNDWTVMFKDSLNEDLLKVITKNLDTIKARLALQAFKPKEKNKYEIVKEFVNQNVSFSTLNYANITRLYLDIARLLPYGYEYKCIECSEKSDDVLSTLQDFEKSLPSILSLDTRLTMLGLLFTELCKVQIVAHLDNFEKIIKKYAC